MSKFIYFLILLIILPIVINETIKQHDFEIQYKTISSDDIDIGTIYYVDKLYIRDRNIADIYLSNNSNKIHVSIPMIVRSNYCRDKTNGIDQNGNKTCANFPNIGKNDWNEILKGHQVKKVDSFYMMSKDVGFFLR